MMNNNDTTAFDSLAAIAGYSSDTRLYEFTFADTDELTPWLDNNGLLVAAFSSNDRLHQVPYTDILVLSRRPDLPLQLAMGRAATLHISLANTSRTHLNGYITDIQPLGSDGGVTRYQLRLSPWLEDLRHATHSRVWQEQSVLAIVDSVFADYAPRAYWDWSNDALSLLSALPVRSYCVQYRESDLAFVTRLLAEDGLSWRVDQDDVDAPDGHTLVLFADSTQVSACPAVPFAPATGLRFAGTGSQQQADSITALSSSHRLIPARVTLASFDYKAKSVVASSVPTQLVIGDAQYQKLPPIEHYDYVGAYAFSQADEAQRHALVIMQALEARQQIWSGLSTVRSLRAGLQFGIDGHPRVGVPGTPESWVSTQVVQAGINNLPYAAHGSAAGNTLVPSLTDWLMALLAPSSDDADTAHNTARQRDQDVDALSAPLADEARAALVATAQRLGYANAFIALPANRPWRPWQSRHLHMLPTGMGSQTARVVGFDGADDGYADSDASGSSPALLGNDEICCDALGRVRIRFQWQDALDQTGSRASCWVRVAQRSAGGGMGSQFLPRIGQEVQVQFMEGDINRPVIVGALYFGQGEAGVPATPAGSLVDADTSALSQATDHSVSAQGNLTAGYAPAWHGAGVGADAHNNAAAQFGIRSQEYSGSGYNQLVFDDSDGAGRIQLKTTQSGTELNLGHLLHTADNYRGSFRGNGIELRTDAWGALRAGSGWLVSSYGVSHSASQRQTAGDVPAGYGLLNTANTLGASLSQLADSHLSVGIAALKGSSKANASYLNDEAAPIPALGKVLQGMVDGKALDAAQGDAAAQNTQADDQHLPHHTDPVISILAKHDLSMTARQDVQFNAGETLNVLNAADSQFTTGGAFRVHSGQAIGLTAGGLKQNQTAGMQLIAAQGDTTIQAHNDIISLKAKNNLDMKSAQASIDFAAATDITLRTAGGAAITIAGGNITVQCPGKILVQAGVKGFTGGASMNYALPQFATSTICIPCLLKALNAGSALASV
ncbi:type VI secretion system Vgr family protein [Sulfuriferula nivalis]|uniref:Type IV secretion protein Rhs n=1 Tax=Sulfuriferula nivalis TaxID=2675298 RepID=A0A809SIV1_9PROT|nr:type VI secretion system Vgr family protein [Sulfuriferula nivalis]BBP02530.1 type IV secretion protein Rhs [Sulfuriferula nivalis]